MNDMIEYADIFVDKLKNDSIYKEYIKAKDEVSKDELVRNKVLAYKKGHLEYQLKKISSSNISQEYEDFANNNYWELMLNDKARHFIECENLLIDEVNKVFNIIYDACEIDKF